MCLAAPRNGSEARVAGVERRARGEWWGEVRRAMGQTESGLVGHRSTLAFARRKAVAWLWISQSPSGCWPENRRPRQRQGDHRETLAMIQARDGAVEGRYCPDPGFIVKGESARLLEAWIWTRQEGLGRTRGFGVKGRGKSRCAWGITGLRMVFQDD